MTTDQLCHEVVKRAYVSVDTSTGLVRAHRFHDKLIGTRNTKGYLVSTLHLDGVRKQVKLHRLVWIAAHGIPPSGTLIDHINGRKHDNRLSNLRAADPKLNSSNRRDYKGVNNPAAKINEAVVAGIRRDYEERDRTKYHHARSYRKLAKEYGVSPTLVAKIIRREVWKI